MNDKQIVQSINLRAFRWAYEQDDLGVTAKSVLITFAIHSNERGYTWPGVELIAFTWSMDRKTVRRQIGELLVRRMIYRTKKRRGATGQVKVYRMPKVTYQSGGKYPRFEKDGSAEKESLKSPISGGGFPPNKEYPLTRAREREPNKRIFCNVSRKERVFKCLNRSSTPSVLNSA